MKLHTAKPCAYVRRDFGYHLRGACIEVLVGAGAWEARQQPYFVKAYGEYNSAWELDYCGLTESHASSSNRVLIIMPTPIDAGLVAHEALHCALRVFSALDVSLSAATEELFAYFIQEVVMLINVEATAKLRDVASSL